MKKNLLSFYLTMTKDMYVSISFFICILLFWCSPLSADTTYKLVQVTSVSSGEKYVFEQDGYVMSNSISSGSLQTTNSYNTTGLTGTEAYVWTLESGGAAGRYKMKNVSVSKYLANSSNSNMTLESRYANASVWSFSFDGTATIRNTSNSDYYLAYTGEPSTHVYRAYSSASYAHAITVYKLESEKVDPTTKWYVNNTKSEELSYKSVYKSEGVCEFYLYTNSTGTVTYTSSDENVATIDEDGKITPLGYGITTITATTAEKENFNSSSASFILSVGDQYVDVLDVNNTDNATAYYKSFTDLTLNSAAKYMGYTSCVGGALRVNSNYTNCIAVSSTAGIVKRVSVKWNSNTTNGRTITVYGRNVAYSSLNTSGTNLGTITYGTNSSFDLTTKATDYGYVGLGADGTLYVDCIVVEWEPPVTIVLPEAGKGYKTFCYPKALDFTGVLGLTAYTATVDDGTALFTPVTGTIPARTGMLLAGEVNTPYEVPCVATSNTDVSTNVMVGVTAATNVAAGIYVLMNVDDNVCFYQTSTTFTVGANTAYIPSDVSESKALNISIVDVAAGMNRGCFDSQDNGIIYNVAGQIVGKDYKGIVVKGRKLYLQK